MERVSATLVLQWHKELESSLEELVKFLMSAVSKSGYAQLVLSLKDGDAHAFIDILNQVSLHNIYVPNTLHTNYMP
jgi:hypothetical protein